MSKDFKKKNDFLVDLSQTLYKKYTKLCLQTYNQLHSIQYRFREIEQFKKEIDFSRVDQIQSEIQEKPQIESDFQEYEFMTDKDHNLEIKAQQIGCLAEIVS